MKKIILLLMALVLTVSINAQEKAVKTSQVIDNVFVGINGGGSWSLMNRDSKFWNNVNPMATINVGRYITPITGLQVSFEAGAREGGRCFIDHTNLTLDGLLNMSNLFGGYKGSPRVFEVVGVLGGGWFHTYGNVSNSASVKGAVELNFNLGKEKAWQLNIIPSYTYLPAKAIENSYVALSAGFTYKFRNSNNTHNFVLVDVRNQNEIDLLNQQINVLREKAELLAKQNEENSSLIKEQMKTIEELTKCCQKARETKQVVSLTNMVSFEIGKAKVGELQMANLSQIAKVLNENSDLNIEIKGYADKDTGTAELNQKLSEQRALNVKNVLVNTFNIDEKRISTVGVGATEQLFDENNWNRVAIFVSK